METWIVDSYTGVDVTSLYEYELRLRLRPRLSFVPDTLRRVRVILLEDPDVPVGRDPSTPPSLKE